MVTFIDTKNREKYQVLFSKAEETIKNAPAEKIPDGIDPNTLEILTLNQYFAYLKDLIALSANENIKSYFLRLPLDEELFEINADTRMIKVPANFMRNGVGVQGDETAEIVYFSIDRYFDHMDLANEDMHIVIQWEARDKDRQAIKGISPNFGKDIETIPGKIIFGWPIYSELTQAAGTIKFAVRFFSLGAEDAQGVRALNYSLATLPAEISIGATIDYDLINKAVMEIDRGKMITDRIKNVGVYDPSVPTPAPAVVTVPLYAVGKEDGLHIVDLPTEPGQGITLRIAAKPGDFGAVQYSWQKFSYNPNYTDETNKYNKPSIELSAKDGYDVSVEYEEVQDNIAEDPAQRDIYYRITSEANAAVQAYAPVSLGDYLAPAVDGYYEYDTIGQGFATLDNSFVKLYRKFGTLIVDGPGIYTVNIGVRNGVNTRTTVMPEEEGIEIPGPLKPEIIDPEDLSVTEDHVAHIIVNTNDEEIVLPVTAIAGETNQPEEKVGHDPVVLLSYAWKHGTDEDNVAVEEETSSFVYSAESVTANKNELTISGEGLSAADLDEVYFAEVTAQRNGIRTTKTSGQYRITHPPIVPVLKRRILSPTTNQLVQIISDFTTETAAIDTRKTNRTGQYGKIAFSVEPIAHSDSLSYIWMRANIDPNETADWDASGAAKLQIDLDDHLAELFADLPGVGDFAVNGDFDLTVLPELGTVVDTEDNGPELVFNEDTEDGYYYCIVVNELNNHKVANVTPFYYVHA